MYDPLKDRPFELAKSSSDVDESWHWVPKQVVLVRAFPGYFSLSCIARLRKAGSFLDLSCHSINAANV